MPKAEVPAPTEPATQSPQKSGKAGCSSAPVPDPARDVRLQVRLILNGHRATDFFRIPANRGRSMAEILQWLKRYMYAHNQRLWYIFGGLFFDDDHPPLFILQQTVRKRKKDRERFIGIPYTNNPGFSAWFTDHVSSGISAKSDLKIEIRVSNYHTRGELVERGSPERPRKKRAKADWCLRRYLRFAAEFEEDDLDEQMEKDRKLREVGLLPSMDDGEEYEHYKPKEWPYACSTLALFGPYRGRKYCASWDHEDDTDDEYSGRWEEIDED
ncbi:uncharacterized protein Z520_00817 [Fonsecaea multimorphosa CBS 102226]|uniref:Uncharacterized protein n=1 Tax=Fonsecaea multimorphosa CBS 102226 TaxID=1442371 RepID=A0A0D2KKV5_9EURO|nr:uncharacterized protein Z520_00817 [Fonsecaea multimorphosa CBS 102226]KIY04125.1 hypothetical protein Z520_00817 [Fonsecaea multimorphosa CBS 102226]OAL31956.1 hypothetical protein AYO22_00826 [Fonsecaea multimorphosa]